MGIRRDVADRLLRAASDAADPRDGVLSRADLRALGVGRDRVSSHVRAGRWRLHGRHTVALHTGELSPTAHAWRGVYESTGDARVDGVTSLKAAGVTGLTDTVVHISLHHLCQVRCIDGVVQHKVSRRLPDECALPGLPRTPPALAALRAAQWAVSDRQAALFLVLPVQQRITTAETLHVTHSQYAGRRRRALIAQLIDDIADGAHSLGEFDLVPALRRRGLPTPDPAGDPSGRWPHPIPRRLLGGHRSGPRDRRCRPLRRARGHLRPLPSERHHARRRHHPEDEPHRPTAGP